MDKVLVKKGLVLSREKAQALILTGSVFVNGEKIEKPGKLICPDADIYIKQQLCSYVSRGGIKLEAVLDKFKINVSGKKAMDVGASTGGFTDCLLQHGAQKVYAIDVGYGQLAWKLQQDKRVINLQRTNIRHLPLDAIPEPIEIAVIDVSFISLKKVIPCVVKFLAPEAELIALIKPQFEVGKGEVGKGGIVKDKTKHAKVIFSLIKHLREQNFKVLGIMESPIKGAKGNREFFIYGKRSL